MTRKNTVKLGYYVPWREMKKGTFWTKYVLSKTKSLLALRLSCFVSLNVFLSRFNAQQWCPRKDQVLNSIGSSVHFFLLFLFFLFFFFILPTYHSLSNVTVAGVCELQAADEKNLTPQRHVFLRSSRYIRMANACLRRHAQIHEENRTCQFPYTLRSQGLRFRSFSIKPLESTRSSSIGFSFSAFFLSPFKQKGHKSVIRNDTKSVTSKLEHVVYLLFWLQMESDCWSIADFLQNSSALSMLTKTYKL